MLRRTGNLLQSVYQKATTSTNTMPSYRSTHHRLRLAVFATIAHFILSLPIGCGMVLSLEIISRNGAIQRYQVLWTALIHIARQLILMVMSGHLGNLCGHKNIILAGALWWMATATISSFLVHLRYISIILTSASIGSALVVPNLIAILISSLPHDGHRNLTMMVFGAMGPLGAGRGHFILQELLKNNWIPLFMYETPILI